MVLAHLAAIQREETALNFGPVLRAGGGLGSLRTRERLRDGVQRIRRHCVVRRPESRT